MAAATETSPNRRRAYWLGASVVLGLALVVRLVLLWQLHRDAPTFADPEGGDSRFYDRVAAGSPGPQRAYFHSPLYQWFLTGLYRLVGRDLLAARAVQLLLGAVTVLLVYWLALRLFRRVSVATLAGAMAGLLGPVAFYEGQLLVDGLIALLALLVLHLLLDALHAPTALRWGLVGLMLGVASLSRAVVLVWLPLVVAIVLARRCAGGRRLGHVAALVGGAAVVILPVTVRNYLVERDVVLITANAGLNLYIGNNPDATGGYNLPEGLWFRPGDPLDDFAGFTVASKALGYVPSSSELSSWWAGKARSFVASHPGQAVDLLVQKLRIVVNDYEYPQMYNYDVYGEVAPVLKLLPRAALVVPAGLVGLGAMWTGRHSRRRRLLAALVGVYALSFMPFFVVGRYRVAWLVLLAPFAAWAVVRLAEAARQRRWRRAGVLLVAMAAGLAATLAPLRAYPTRVNQHLAFARARLDAGDPHGASQWARRATEVEPSCAEAWAVRARAMRLAGQPRVALELLAGPAAAHPEAWSIHRELGATWLSLGAPESAQAALEQCLELQPGEVEAWLLLGEALEQLACWQRAAEAYRAAEGLAHGATAARQAQRRIRELDARQTALGGAASGEPEHCAR